MKNFVEWAINEHPTAFILLASSAIVFWCFTVLALSHWSNWLSFLAFFAPGIVTAFYLRREWRARK